MQKPGCMKTCSRAFLFSVFFFDAEQPAEQPPQIFRATDHNDLHFHPAFLRLLLHSTQTGGGMFLRPYRFHRQGSPLRPALLPGC